MNSKKRKTYRRLLGTIFFGGFRPALVAGRQWFAKEKTTKRRKMTKKSVIFLERIPRFSSKEGGFF
jgi:hypothetical protein